MKVFPPNTECIAEILRTKPIDGINSRWQSEPCEEICIMVGVVIEHPAQTVDFVIDIEGQNYGRFIANNGEATIWASVSLMLQPGQTAILQILGANAERVTFRVQRYRKIKPL